MIKMNKFNETYKKIIEQNVNLTYFDVNVEETKNEGKFLIQSAPSILQFINRNRNVSSPNKFKKFKSENISINVTVNEIDTTIEIRLSQLDGPITYFHAYETKSITTVQDVIMIMKNQLSNVNQSISNIISSLE